MTVTQSPVDSRRTPARVRRYLAGFGADAIGDLLWYVSLAWVAAQVGRGWGGAILFAGAIPSLILAPFGGVLADRLGVGRVIRWTLAARVVAMAGWAGIVASGTDIRPALLLAAALLLGCVDGVHLPALETWPLTLADDADTISQTRIFAAERTITRSAQAVAGLGAGELLARWGPVTPALVAGGLFFAAALLFARLGRLAVCDSPAEPGAGFVAGARRGLTAVVRDPVLRRTVPSHSVVNMLTGGVMLVAMPLWMARHGWSARWFGAAFTCWGLGLLAGTLMLLRVLPRLRRTVAAGLSAGILTGLALLAAIWSDRPTVTIAAVTVAGVSCGPLGPCLGGYLRERIVDHPDRGAVTGFQTLALSGLEPVGYAVTGAVCAAAGPTAAIAACASAVILVCGWALTTAAVLVATGT